MLTFSDFMIVAAVIVGIIRILQLIGIIEKPKKRNTKNNYNKNKYRKNKRRIDFNDDYSPFDYDDGINSATGLPMNGGIDIEGNPAGCNFSDDGSF